MPQAGGVVAVLVAGGNHQQAEADDVGDAVPDAIRIARVRHAGGLAVGNAEVLLDPAQRQDAAIRGELPAIEPGDDGLAADR